MSNQPHLDPEPQDVLSRRLSRALETPRTFSIPADFATRTALAAAQLRRPAAASRHVPFATLAIRAAFAALAVAMLALAEWTRTAQSPEQLVLFGTEIAFALEFVALTTWLSLRPPSTR